MNDQDKKNLDLAVKQFGTADRQYRFFFSATGAVITVSIVIDIGQVWGDGLIKKL